MASTSIIIISIVILASAQATYPAQAANLSHTSVLWTSHHASLSSTRYGAEVLGTNEWCRGP